MKKIKGIIYSVLIDFFETHIPQQEFLSLKKLQGPDFDILKEAWVMSNHYPVEYFKNFVKILHLQQLDKKTFFNEAGKYLAGRIMRQYFNIYINTTPEKFLKNFVLIFPQIWGLDEMEYRIYHDRADFIIPVGEMVDEFRLFFKAFIEEMINLSGSKDVSVIESEKGNTQDNLLLECIWKVTGKDE